MSFVAEGEEDPASRVLYLWSLRTLVCIDMCLICCTSHCQKTLFKFQGGCAVCCLLVCICEDLTSLKQILLYSHYLLSPEKSPSGPKVISFVHNRRDRGEQITAKNLSSNLMLLVLNLHTYILGTLLLGRLWFCGSNVNFEVLPF